MKLTAKVTEQLVKMWNEGATNVEIARSLGISRAVVEKYAHKHRDLCPKRIKRPVRKSRVNHEELLKLWNQGVPKKEIIKKLGICKSYLYVYVNRHEIAHVDKLALKINHEEFIKLWALGVTTRKIAERFDISKSSVINYAKKHENECPKRMGKIEHEKFVELWKSGCSCKMMAKEFGVSVGTIINYGCKYREECPSRKRKTI